MLLATNDDAMGEASAAPPQTNAAEASSSASAEINQADVDELAATLGLGGPGAPASSEQADSAPAVEASPHEMLKCRFCDYVHTKKGVVTRHEK